MPKAFHINKTSEYARLHRIAANTKSLKNNVLPIPQD